MPPVDSFNELPWFKSIKNGTERTVEFVTLLHDVALRMCYTVTLHHNANVTLFQKAAAAF